MTPSERRTILAELRAIDLPTHAAELEFRDGTEMLLTPQFARTLVAVNEALGPIRVVAVRDLRRAAENTARREP